LRAFGDIGGMINQASKSMDEAEANFHDRDRENEARRATNPSNATRPTIDLEHRN